MNHSGDTMNIYTGPAGWSYKDWNGIFYPGRSGIDRLSFTAGYFNCIELNSSFYRIPPSGMVRSWEERIPRYPRFQMTVKAFREFTHDRLLKENTVNEFIDRFEPLSSERSLGAFLFQFPWSFRHEDRTTKHLMKIGNLFRDYPIVAELRHGSWNCRDSFQLLSDYGFTLCSIDQPLIGDSVPPLSRITNSKLGYIRLHGRNRKDWFRKEAGRDQRYDYLYSEDEIREWTERARDISAKVEKLFIITNNHFRGQALVNAFQIRSVLEGRKVDPPSSLLREYPVLEKISSLPGGQQSLPDID
ncbi:MAG: DUF72 domain-containing protein [Candidatus Latescibacteria bacterium]|nr:DUF72 domain-containing protein [bacterium]MBD3423463.1 DUF72 domain-containing protein [Candidatus Latescibacterota bacterium]